MQDLPASPEPKRARPETLNPDLQDLQDPQKPCAKWTVDDVCEFITSVELCKPYVEVWKKY
jgi:hypothetical protein